MANAEWEKVYQIKGLPVKFVWRGSPYNDLKATMEGGNRDYVTVARIVASSPISQAEAEKLAGEKWRQIKKTARNANAARSRNAVVQKALNARWRIIYKNLSGPLFPYGKETYSTREEAEKRAEELRKRGREWGSNASYFVDEVGNSRSANADTSVLRETAVNAKFNVGEGVLVARYHHNSIPVGKVGIIRYFDGDEYLVESGPNQGWYKESELIKKTSRSWRADIVRSGGTPRNAVVAKAMNASHKRRS